MRAYPDAVFTAKHVVEGAAWVLVRPRPGAVFYGTASAYPAPSNPELGFRHDFAVVLIKKEVDATADPNCPFDEPGPTKHGAAGAMCGFPGAEMDSGMDIKRLAYIRVDGKNLTYPRAGDYYDGSSGGPVVQQRSLVGSHIGGSIGRTFSATDAEYLIKKAREALGASK